MLLGQQVADSSAVTLTLLVNHGAHFGQSSLLVNGQHGHGGQPAPGDRQPAGSQPVAVIECDRAFGIDDLGRLSVTFSPLSDVPKPIDSAPNGPM